MKRNTELSERIQKLEEENQELKKKMASREDHVSANNYCEFVEEIKAYRGEGEMYVHHMKGTI